MIVARRKHSRLYSQRPWPAGHAFENASFASAPPSLLPRISSTRRGFFRVLSSPHLDRKKSVSGPRFLRGAYCCGSRCYSSPGLSAASPEARSGCIGTTSTPHHTRRWPFPLPLSLFTPPPPLQILPLILNTPGLAIQWARVAARRNGLSEFRAHLSSPPSGGAADGGVEDHAGASPTRRRSTEQTRGRVESAKRICVSLFVWKVYRAHR
ncbi:hypothetical protein MRX96_029457 [Rhipicephalus microplus]